MNPKQIGTSLRTLIPLKQPVFIWGAPGVGKSQVVAPGGRRARPGSHRYPDRAAGPGRPARAAVRHGGCRPLVPRRLSCRPKARESCSWTNSTPRLPWSRPPATNWCLTAGWGSIPCPTAGPWWRRGNRETDRAVTHRMPSALANRFVHLDFSVDAAAWLEWAESAGIGEEILAFIRFRPKLLHDFDPKKDVKAFPSPRSWEFAARILASAPDPEVELSLLKGTVGPGAAAEFAGFSPDVQAIARSGCCHQPSRHRIRPRGTRDLVRVVRAPWRKEPGRKRRKT